MRGFRQRQWHLDEIYVMIHGEMQYLRRAWTLAQLLLEAGDITRVAALQAVRTNGSGSWTRSALIGLASVSYR